MDVEAIRARLEALLVKRGRPSVFRRSWSLTPEPVTVQSEALGALLKGIAPARSSGAPSILPASRDALARLRTASVR